MKNFSIILIRFYRMWSSIKHQILFSVFGYNFYCKHSPTCSRYLESQLKTHGTIVGLSRGILRIISCW